MGENEKVDEAPMKPVLKKLNRLEDLVDGLEGTINSLETSLEGVLTPESPRDSRATDAKPEETQCPLAHRLNETTARIMRMIERVNRLNNRVEL